MFNNREIAIAIWLLIFLIWVIAYKNIRKEIGNVLKIVFSTQILSHILLVLIYSSVIVWGLWHFKIWDKEMLKDTVLWYLFVALPLLFKSNVAKEEMHYFRKIAIDTLKLTIILEYIVNFYVFNLLVEIIIVPVLSFIGIISAFSEGKNEAKQVKRIADLLLGLFGLSILAYSIHHIFIDYKNFLAISNLRGFLSPIILTLCYIPLLYILTIRMIYEQLFVRINWQFNKDKKTAKQIIHKIFGICLLDIDKLKRVSKSITYYNTDDKNELKEHILNCASNAK